jgi:ABC-type transport system substrate-binding protein
MRAGAGPYVMTKRDNTGTFYERNPNYYKHSPAEGPYVEDGPYIDAWDELIIADPVAAEARFLEGDLDFLNSALVSLDKLKAEELEGEDGVVISRHTSPANYPMTLDNAKWAPHPQLRQALSMAIDREAYINNILLGDGIYGSPVGPIFDSVLSQDELKELQPFNPQEARQMWEAGGGNEVFPDGLRTISATFSTAGQVNVDFIKRQLEENLGVSVTVTPADLAAYVAIATEAGPVKQWEFFMASEGSLTTIEDYNALTFWSPGGYGAIFGNCKLDSTVPENASFAKHAQERFDAQSRILDKEERDEYLRDMQREYLREMRPAIPLPVGAYVYTARRDRVKNYPENDAQLGNSSLGAYRAHNLYLEG